MTEAIMTLQTFSPSWLVPARDARAPSLWRRLLDAIMESRQRKADAGIVDYLERHSGPYHDELRAMLSRRRASR
jgi:hypothetical protein